MWPVLLVDDEHLIRDVMRRWLETLGYEPAEAASAEEALEVMAKRPAAVAFCDIAMPGHDGLWLAERLRALYPDTAVIMVTGTQEVDAALTSLHAGAVDYLAKPFTREQLRDSMRLGMKWHRNAIRARQRAATLEVELRERLAPLADYLNRIPVTSNGALNQMLESLGLDRVTLEHSQRVSMISVNLSLALGLRSPELADIERAALLHDVGRLSLPKTILSKPASLTEEEHAVIRLQPKLVHEIIKTCPFLEPAADLVRSAYERFDGTGYPWGLKGEEIPLGARIIAAADAFDAMTHQRLHRDARALPEALFEIQRCRGTQFDPIVVDALLKVASLHWHRGAPKVVSGESVDNPHDAASLLREGNLDADDDPDHREDLGSLG
ncbi:MAG: response regulator [Acidobacteria bacterium]|nr:response regulator [Acidobacteriota bacterium]